MSLPRGPSAPRSSILTATMRSSLRVVGLPHFAHASGADPFEQPIATQSVFVHGCETANRRSALLFAAAGALVQVGGPVQDDAEAGAWNGSFVACEAEHEESPARTVDATHAAGAGVGDDLERTKTRPGFEPHECVPRL